MTALVLVLLAVVLAGPTPRLMARRHGFRRSPRAALAAWQAVTISAILATLAAAPAIAPLVLFDGQAVWQHFMVLALAGALSGIMLVRLLVAGHKIGRRMRVLRARHRELVDIIALEPAPGSRVRVLAHETPTAYCLPGRQSRVVVSTGVLKGMEVEALRAVLAHERAHLRARHDLLIEFFSVVHETVPAFLRSSAAMREVRLLVEVLADRHAIRRVGPEATRQALVGLAGAATPEAALGAGLPTTSARLDLIDHATPQPLLGALIYTYSATLILLPLGLLAQAWGAL